MALTRGAEALLEPTTSMGRAALAKRRVAKGYRHAELDRRLRTQRTRDEANLLLAARQAGVAVPVVFDVDRVGHVLVLELIEGRTLREQLADDDEKDGRQRLTELGRMAGRLHAAGLTHGDLTTSNVLVPDPAASRLVLVDFGLGAFSEEPEPRGVDLHLVEEALHATQATADGLFAAFLAGYREAAPSDVAEQAIRRLYAIRERGRYR